MSFKTARKTSNYGAYRPLFFFENAQIKAGEEITMKKNQSILRRIQKTTVSVGLFDCVGSGLLAIIAMMVIRCFPNNDLADNIIILSTAAIFVIGSVLVTFVNKKISHHDAQCITEPISKLVAAAESIADGKLDVDLDINAVNETGILAESFKKIVAALQLMKQDVDMMIGEAIEGRLDTRADASKQKGDYKAIIEGVNKMFDTIKEPLDVASGFIDRLADGEHQDNIENTYKGYYAVLIDNLNKVRSSLEILSTESSKLAQAGVNGDLDVRGDEEKLSGIYAQIVHGVNETFDAIKNPLDVASVFIGELASGTAEKPVSNVYRGYYADLIDNLNHVQESLMIMLGESLRLAQAGKNGDLSARSDTSKIPGHYADLVGGMNGILEAVSVPVNEAVTVLKNIAVDDFTVKMEGNYEGSFKDLAGSINGVLDRLSAVERFIIDVGNGAVNKEQIEALKSIGKRSDNDNLTPSMIQASIALDDLIDISSRFALAATQGNLEARPDIEKFNGGYRKVVEGMVHTMEAISTPIEEASSVLKSVADADLTVAVTGQYQGEYNRIKESVNKTIDAFNFLLGQINVSASQVSAGSKQVSNASQLLSQGATEQASSVEELTSTITEVAAQIKQNAGNAAQASKLSSSAQQEAAQGTEKMNEMLVSMQEINDSSLNISKIIKVIDDIAFQTNILALNAAVEAARAGQAGKGFAVVANEVKNLAAKSAEAAKNTTALIEGSITKVEAGTRAANETAEMLNQISESIRKTSGLVGNIAAASGEQATAIAQIDQGITQVSAVVQTNSATAEESAASSEELSGQAETLLHMVGKFQLKKDDVQKVTAEIKSPNESPAKARKPLDTDSGLKISLAGEFGKY